MDYEEDLDEILGCWDLVEEQQFPQNVVNQKHTSCTQKQKLSLTNKKQDKSYDAGEMNKFRANNDSIASNKSQVSMHENGLNDSITNA